jgi:hypothetical protein
MHTTLLAQEHKPAAHQYPCSLPRRCAHLNFLSGLEYPDCAMMKERLRSDLVRDQMTTERSDWRSRVDDGAGRWVGE